MTSLLRQPLSAMEQMILRNIISGEHLNGVTLANQKEHDETLIALIRRGLVNYNRHRPRQKFAVTSAGRQQLAAEEKRNEVRRGAVLPQATAMAASPKDRDTADHVDFAGDGSAPAAIGEFTFHQGPEWSGCPSCKEMIPSHRGVLVQHWLDGKQCEWSGRRPPRPKGPGARVTAIDVANGVITLGGGK